MDYHDVFGITLDPVAHMLDQQGQVGERRRVMVVPVEVHDPAIKALLLVRGLTHIKYVVLLWMVCVKKSFDLNFKRVISKIRKLYRTFVLMANFYTILRKNDKILNLEIVLNKMIRSM